MNIKEFENYYDKLNEKETEFAGEMGELYTWLEYVPGKHKITFLDKFIEVFKEESFGTLYVDENIGFINNECSFYVNEQFLDFCLDKKIYGEKAWTFYEDNLEDNMGDERVSYEDTYTSLNL